jgi:hypothetical protein
VQVGLPRIEGDANGAVAREVRNDAIGLLHKLGCRFSKTLAELVDGVGDVAANRGCGVH